MNTETQTIAFPDFAFPREALVEKLRVKSDSKRAELFTMIDELESRAKPVVYYRRVQPVFEGTEGVVLGDVRIASPTLNTILGKGLPLDDGNKAVFAFAATCGQEATDWGAAREMGLATFWAQTILEHGMYALLERMEKTFRESCAGAAVSTIEPGIPKDWPLSQQTDVFAVLGGTAADFGITLNDQSLNLPFRYLAGVAFFTKRILPWCGYCHFEGCNRKMGGCWRLQLLRRRDAELAAEAMNA